MNDRMERVRGKAREYWSAKPGFPPAMIAALSDAEVRGADAYRTLTDAEWEAMREDVKAAMIDHGTTLVLELPDDELDCCADAAMTAMGFKKMS